MSFIPFAKFFFPLKTSVIPPANPPAISATPETSDTATPAITATTSSAIFISLLSADNAISPFSTTYSLFYFYIINDLLIIYTFVHIF